MKFVQRRIGDPRILQLTHRWLKVGVLEDGKVLVSEEGTPQGGSISVLLSNRTCIMWEELVNKLHKFKFKLKLEPSKIRLIEFGKLASRYC